ncbi:MAG: protein kinase [Planctomycetaceae bacterium]|nr:protein kinase [Planctomycetaceae bacterium]
MTLPSFSDKREPAARQCPTEDMLREFLEVRLPEAETRSCEVHVEECPQCQQRIEQITDCGAWRSALLRFSPNAECSHETKPEDLTQIWPRYLADEEAEEQFPAETITSERFEIREMVGRGGCGTVFRAWDQVLRREVALKVPHWALAYDPRMRMRFETEARATARLNHPNIVPVFEASFSGNACYLVTEYVAGSSLADWLDRKAKSGERVEISTVVAIVVALAEAVELAHQCGILHRDLKPSNVLLDTSRCQGVLPFVPRITDFGLARLNEPGQPITATGDIFGSLPYMSPEQVHGDHLAVGQASDVYALGVILYELLTGQLPFKHPNPAEMLRMIVDQPPTAPRRVGEEVPADLEAIVLNALEKRPRERYGSAADLAADLGRFSRGEVVSVRRPGILDQTRRWLRQHSAVTMVGGISLLAFACVLVVLLVSNQQQSRLNSALGESNRLLSNSLRNAEILRNQAELSRTEAERQARATQEQLYVSHMQRAGEAWEHRDLAELQLLLGRYAGPEAVTLRGIEWDLLSSKVNTPHRELTQMESPVYALAYSRDGQLLAATGEASIVRIVRIADGETLGEWDTGQIEANGVLFDKEDRVLWTVGDDGSICEWDVSTGQELQRLRGHAPEQSHELLVVEERNLLITSGSESYIRLWDRETGASLGMLEGHELNRRVWNPILHPDGRHLYTASLDHTVRMWDLEEQRSVNGMKFAMQERPCCLALSRDGQWLAVASLDRAVHILEAATLESRAKYRFRDMMDRVAIDDRRGVVYALDRQSQVHSLPLPQATADPQVFDMDPKTSVCRAHASRAYDVRLSPDQQSLITCGHDGAVRLWPLETLNPERYREYRGGKFHNDRHVTAHGWDGKHVLHVDNLGLHLLRASDMTLLSELDREHGTFDRVFALQDGRFMAMGPPGRICVLSTDPLTIEEEHFFPQDHRADYCFGGVASHGHLVAGKRPDFTRTDLFSIGLQPALDMSIPGGCSEIAFNRQGTQVAICLAFYLQVWDTLPFSIAWRSQDFVKSFTCVSFSPDGRWLVAANSDRNIHCWEKLSNFEAEKVLTGHRGQVTDLVISQDGRTLISGDIDGKLKFWHLTTGEPLYDLAFPGSIRSLSLAPNDSELLVTVKGDVGRIIRVPIKGPR